MKDQRHAMFIGMPYVRRTMLSSVCAFTRKDTMIQVCVVGGVVDIVVVFDDNLLFGAIFRLS